MYKVTKYPHGTFSWADCHTTDYEAVKTFYADIMGWEIEELPLYGDVSFTRFKLDGENVAALIPIPDDKEESSHWKNFITVDDVEALVDTVTENGGTILDEPFDAMDDGRMMIIQDPVGATVALWQPKEMIGAGIVNTAGAMLWNDLATREPQKAMDFYGKLLGWEFRAGDGDGYHEIVNQGRVNGGIMTMGEEYGEMPSFWNVYFNVADLDATLEKVRSKGGTVNLEAEAKGVGRFAVIADPQGVGLTLMQAHTIDTWEE